MYSQMFAGRMYHVVPTVATSQVIKLFRFNCQRGL